MDESKRQDLKQRIELLGMTRDRQAIQTLRPLLKSSVVLFDPMDPSLAMPAMGGQSSAPLRTCDAAAAAILKILGREDAALALLGTVPRPRGRLAPGREDPAMDLQQSIGEQLTTRDERIEALRDELAKPAKERD